MLDPLAAPLGAAAAGGSAVIDADYREWLVTVRVDENRTQDFPVRSHSAHGARAQHLQRHPGARVIAVRLKQR